MPAIPTLGTQRQEDLSYFQSGLVHSKLLSDKTLAQNNKQVTRGVVDDLGTQRLHGFVLDTGSENGGLSCGGGVWPSSAEQFPPDTYSEPSEGPVYQLV